MGNIANTMDLLNEIGAFVVGLRKYDKSSNIFHRGIRKGHM